MKSKWFLVFLFLISTRLNALSCPDDIDSTPIVDTTIGKDGIIMLASVKKIQIQYAKYKNEYERINAKKVLYSKSRFNTYKLTLQIHKTWGNSRLKTAKINVLHYEWIKVYKGSGTLDHLKNTDENYDENYEEYNEAEETCLDQEITLSPTKLKANKSYFFFRTAKNKEYEILNESTESYSSRIQFYDDVQRILSALPLIKHNHPKKAISLLTKTNFDKHLGIHHHYYQKHTLNRMLATSYSKLKMIDKSIAILRKSLSSEGADIRTHYNLACYYSLKNDLKNSHVYMNKVFKTKAHSSLRKKLAKQSKLDQDLANYRKSKYYKLLYKKYLSKY